MTAGRTLRLTHNVHDDDNHLVQLTWDLGKWTISTLERKNQRLTAVTVTPEAMDALVAGWPRFKEAAQ